MPPAIDGNSTLNRATVTDASIVTPMTITMNPRFSRISRQETTTRRASTGMISAALAWITAVLNAVSCSSPGARSTPPSPNQVGIPTAPKDTGTVFIMRQRMATGRGAKPSPTSSGAASAAGVPKPLTPSIRNEKAQPRITSCATRFVEIPLSHDRTVAIAPECSMVLNSKIAPQTMSTGVSAVRTPLLTAACTSRGLTAK
jgi:hypothetical protein